MINSLAMLTSRRNALQKDLRKSEKTLSRLWDELFHEQGKSMRSSSPTQKILSIISNSSVIIDGAILGWKLYNRFGRKRR